MSARYRDPLLRGIWRGYREAHIEPDWLVIYRVEGDELHLIRTGTHSDLFREQVLQALFPLRSDRCSAASYGAGHGARPTTFTEAEVEEAAFKWLQGLRWNVAHGTDIASDPPNAERNDYGQAVPERVYEALTSPHRISRRLSARLLPACPACLLQTGGRRQATPP